MTQPTTLPSTYQPKIAYFSMEVGLKADIPTYSGDLGVLAGYTIRAAADLGLPMIAVTLLHRKGCFRQHIDAAGWQTEEAVDWGPERYLRELPVRAAVAVHGRSVQIRAWVYEVAGRGGPVVPVLLLDTQLAENSEWDRTLTHYLYGGDE